MENNSLFEDEIQRILPKLISGDINKKECYDKILNVFSSWHKLHSNVNEGDEILYNGNPGILIKKGDKKSTIKYHNIGYIENEHNTFVVDVYNIEFFKIPEGYWD